jgi:hypothetical protein
VSDKLDSRKALGSDMEGKEDTDSENRTSKQKEDSKTNSMKTEQANTTGRR